MTTYIKGLFAKLRPKKPETLSEFFRDFPAKKRLKILEEVAKEANADQRALVERYEKLHPKTT